MLDEFKAVPESLGYEVDVGVGKDGTGREIPFLAFKHGDHRMAVIEQGAFAEVMYPMDIAPEDTEHLKKEPDELVEELLSILKREMLEGRSGYVVVTEPNQPKAVKQIRVSQRILAKGPDPQRVADGIQEIVAVAVRAQLVLGAALRSVATAAKISSSTFNPGMYR